MDKQASEAVDQIVAIVTSYGLDVLGALAILIVGWIAAGWAGRATFKAAGRSRRIDVTLQRLFAGIVKYGVIVFTVLATLQQFGVETTSLLAVLGAAGLAVGLALQGTLSNVAAGVMLLVFRPFKVGDFIESGSVSGTVVELALFTTELRTADGIYVLVPNGDLWGQALRNYSRNDTRRIQIVLGIDYGDDIGLALETAKKVVEAEPLLLREPEPQFVVAAMAESSIDIYVRAWATTADFWTAFFNLNRNLKEACDAAGITIPFPQRTLHIERSEAAE